MAIEVILPPRMIHFIDLLLKIPDLEILNPLSTLGCRNGGVALDLESLLLFLPNQNFPPSVCVCSVFFPSLMNLILPRQPLSLFGALNLSLDFDGISM